MLDNGIINKARELLAEGRLSQRKIAKILGISNTMVSLIHHQKRKPFSEAAGNPIAEPDGPIMRCPVCGGKTRLPCVYCQIVDHLQKNGPAGPVAESDQKELTIELRGDHAKRYEKVRKWRSSQPNPFFTDIPEDWPWRSKRDDACHERTKAETSVLAETLTQTNRG